AFERPNRHPNDQHRSTLSLLLSLLLPPSERRGRGIVPHCNGVSPPAAFLASSISVTAMRISARVLRSGASSIACFSAAPYGDIIARALTSASFGALSIPCQSALRSFA